MPTVTFTDRLWLQEVPGGKQRLPQPLQAGEGGTRLLMKSQAPSCSLHQAVPGKQFHLGLGRSRRWEVRKWVQDCKWGIRQWDRL